MKEQSTKPEMKGFYHQSQRSKKRTRSYLKFVGITTVLLVSFALYAVISSSTDDTQLTLANMSAESRLEQYHDLILTGDQSLSDGNYHEAASRYRDALQMMPKDSIATLRLISASDLDCVTNAENCGESDKLLGEFVEF